MAEFPIPTPLQITERVHGAAAEQGLHAFSVDEAELAAAFDDTRRSELTGAAAITIGAAKRFGGDPKNSPMFEGAYISGDKEPAQPGLLTAGGEQSRTVLHLQIDPRVPITQSDLAQRLAETLSVPARMKNTLIRAAGAVCLAAGTLAETVSFAKYDAVSDPTPGSWKTWLLAGGVALVAGGGAIAEGVRRGRRITNGENRAATRTPIVVQ